MEKRVEHKRESFLIIQGKHLTRKLFHKFQQLAPQLISIPLLPVPAHAAETRSSELLQLLDCGDTGLGKNGSNPPVCFHRVGLATEVASSLRSTRMSLDVPACGARERGLARL
ncbi:hypothetical protein M378DRAFT_569252 [Amanita muscaria Koide BX008]|uniref:Uncharacterized protein n=1 Tax=Amanita muscaria (strain Koide BX008) TaxID=946122 RepID=A0A0C2RZH6_AMAMK|nr:hypothetical protein M378DRAFT_569252 [Amanita muscaria Koide BX008]